MHVVSWKDRDGRPHEVATFSPTEARKLRGALRNGKSRCRAVYPPGARIEGYLNGLEPFQSVQVSGYRPPTPGEALAAMKAVAEAARRSA
jgi:hypothetical protein